MPTLHGRPSRCPSWDATRRASQVGRSTRAAARNQTRFTAPGSEPRSRCYATSATRILKSVAEADGVAQLWGRVPSRRK